MLNGKMKEILIWTEALLRRQTIYDGSLTASNASYERYGTERRGYHLAYWFDLLVAGGYMERNDRNYRITPKGRDALTLKAAPPKLIDLNLFPNLPKNECLILLAVLNGQSREPSGITLTDILDSLRMTRANSMRYDAHAKSMADRGILAIHNNLITVTPAGLTLASQSAALAHFCKIIVDNLKK
jgi:hypothetical protein